MTAQQSLRVWVKEGVMRALSLALVVALAIASCLLLSASARTHAADGIDGLQRLSIHVSGQSFFGFQYGRRLDVERTSSGWGLKHSCWSRPGARACGCADGTRELPEADLRKLVEFIATFKDGGGRAQCCDHPWTEIERRYAGGRTAKATVSFDVLTIAEVFNVCGSPLVPLDVHDPGSLLRFGQQLNGVGQEERADEALEQAIGLDAARVPTEAYEQLSQTYSNLGKYEKALAALGVVLGARSRDSAVLLQLGALHEKFGRSQEAVGAYQEALRAAATPEAKRAAYYSLGSLYKDLRRFDQAAAAFREVLRLKPDDDYARYNLGQVYVELGDIGPALEQYHALKASNFQYADDLRLAAHQRAVRDNPKDADAHFNLGNAYYWAQRYTDAIGPYTAATRLQPDLALAYSRLGYSYAQLDRSKEALQALQHAVRLGDDARDYTNLGYVLRIVGRNEEAVEALRQAIGRDPNQAVAHDNLGLAYMNLARFDDAVTALQSAVRLQPDDPDARFELGLAYQHLGRDREAIDTFTKAVDLRPNFGEARFELGRSYLRLGERDAARRVYEDLKRVDKKQAEKLQSLMGK